MKKYKRIIKISLSLITVLALIFLFIYFKLPSLLKSESSLKEDILKITPYGMSMDGVLEIIENKYGWHLHTSESENIIRSYHVTTYPKLAVKWIFDENKELIDIEISKDWGP